MDISAPVKYVKRWVNFFVFAAIGFVRIEWDFLLLAPKNFRPLPKDKVAESLYPTDEDREACTYAGIVRVHRLTMGSATCLKDRWERWPRSWLGYMLHDEGDSNGHTLRGIDGKPIITSQAGCDLAMMDQCVAGALHDHHSHIEEGSINDPEHLTKCGDELANRLMMIAVSYKAVKMIGPRFRKAFGMREIEK